MKRSIFALAAIAVLSATPALAQTTTEQPQSTMTSSTGPTSSCGNVPCPGTGGAIIDVKAGAGHAGDFRAMFDAGANGTGSATATKEGGAFSIFEITYDGCSAAECVRTGNVTASVGGYEIGQSMATANNTTSGQWAITQNHGVAQAAGQLVITKILPTALPAQANPTASQK